MEKELLEKFGIHNAESWIVDQKHASAPDVAGWEKLIRKRPEGLGKFDPIDLLRRFGQPLQSGELAARGVPLCLMDHGRIQAFAHTGLDFIFEIANPAVFLVEGLSICDYHFDDVQHSWHLVDATLLRAWRDRTNDGSSANQARDQLCRPYAAMIEKMAHELRAEYDSSTTIAIRFNGEFEFSHGPVRIERVVVWSWDEKNGFEAELCPGSAFDPDSFGDFNLEQNTRHLVSVEDALYGTEKSRFRRRRLLMEPLEFLRKGDIRFGIFWFVGGQVLFVHRSNLMQPAPAGEKLL